MANLSQLKCTQTMAFLEQLKYKHRTDDDKLIQVFKSTILFSTSTWQMTI